MPEVLASEIIATAGARELRDGEVVVVGLGLPQVACVLAKRTHAPRLSALLEIGVMNMSPIDTAVGLADARIWYRATCWSGFLDVMGMNVHRGVVDVGFLGALEIDRYGNINTTLVKDDSGRVRYVNGSAGGNDIASLAKRVIMIMRHEKRKLPQGIGPARRWPASSDHRHGCFGIRSGYSFRHAGVAAPAGSLGRCRGEYGLSSAYSKERSDYCSSVPGRASFVARGD